jgi:iron complex outermembrane receptor protein
MSRFLFLSHWCGVAAAIATCASVFGPASLAQAQSAPAAGAPAQSAPPPVRISQNVFVTASVADIPLSSLSRTVAVFTREDLERLGVTSVVDALRLLPGIDPRARGPRDVQTDFSIRGAAFGQNLVLVDGVRLNDAQSGHHNGEIPASVSAIDRVEVMYGAGSSVHGADALGGTINVISRKGPFATASVQGGQYGYFAAQGGLSGGRIPSGWALNGWGSRSDNFRSAGALVNDRDHATGGASVRGELEGGFTVDLRHQRRSFGANGFYGNSPSKEWTDMTLASLTWKRAGNQWAGAVRGYVRQHHDHFRWDIARPGFAENRHRTNATEVEATVERVFASGVRATIGGAGGGDWVRSNNLGNHDFSRMSAFGEVVVPVASRATLQGGLRADDYSTFGRSVSPSVSMVVNASPDLRIHAGASHAFRIPTFTELYYTDPANQASADLRAEQGWSYDAGVDWTRGGWTLSASPFRRDDSDVIDWVRETSNDIWRTTNVRDVTTTGVELSAARRWRTSLARVYFAALDVDAPSLALLSKYALEYARRQAGASVALPIGAGLRAAVNVDFRTRLVGGADTSYALVGARVSRSFTRGEVFVDASNLADQTYKEILGVAMPGRWVTAGVTLR